MKFEIGILLTILSPSVVKAFTLSPGSTSKPFVSNNALRTETSLRVSVGLGPEADEKDKAAITPEEAKEPLVEPDHELFRDSRLSNFDKECDTWFGNMLGKDDDQFFLGKVSEEASRRIRTLNKLERDHEYEIDHEEWTPYQSTKLIESPILPAYGLEQYGLPVPRRNAEAWKHFDVPGLVGTDYSNTPTDIGSELLLDEATTSKYIDTLKQKGSWIDDDECTGRLIYINGRFVPSLSFTSDIAKNICAEDFASGAVSDDDIEKLNRLTDGFTDRLAADVPSGETEFLTSLKKLSGPHHHVGEPTSQFSINTQQGTACFVALNSVKAGSVAHISVPDDMTVKPVIVVNAVTADGGLSTCEEGKGVASHPRAFVTAGANSNLSFIQSFADLDDADTENTNQKFVNSCTQIYVGSGAKVTHSYLEESGGIVTSGVEADDDTKKNAEAKRKALKDTHFESIDVHVVGEDGKYAGVLMTVGGKGRSRISISASLLKPGSHADIKGFSLSGGSQRSDVRTNIHHVAQATTSRQSQKNMIGGRATTTFKGRIRVEQSAQQTDSEQIARTIMLSDKSKVWAIPSLEIIADDVTCTHGATVSDLSEEELFYLRSRGIDRTTARNMLMFAFVDDIAAYVDPIIHGDKEDEMSLKNRIITRLQNVVPQGERAIQGDYSSV